MNDKEKRLEEYLKSLGKVAVAFSGGIDSSCLLMFANKVLGKENCLAIIANGQMVTRKDYKDAIEFLNENEFNYEEIQVDALETLEFRENHKDRCYYCKKNLMSKVKEIANKNGFINVVDGKNTDDTKVYRPGNKATQELNILSPLELNDFSKDDIRDTSKKMGIKYWNKPSNSCLATRFPYNTVLTNEKLMMVEKSEELIKDLKIPKVRVRCHDDIARIEVDAQYYDKIIGNTELINKIKENGFKYVTLDLSGLTSGVFDK